MATIATKYRLLALVDYLTESLQQPLEIDISSSSIYLKFDRHF